MASSSSSLTGSFAIPGQDEAAEQVVAGLPALAGDQPAQVAHEAPDRRHGPNHRPLRHVGGDDDAGPALEARAIAAGDTQHLRDDDGRDRQSVIAHQIDRPGAACPVEQIGAQRMDARSHRLDHLRREGSLDQSAQAAMIGRRGREVRVSGRAKPGSRADARPGPVHVLGERSSLEQGDDIGVARDQPGACRAAGKRATGHSARIRARTGNGSR